MSRPVVLKDGIAKKNYRLVVVGSNRYEEQRAELLEATLPFTDYAGPAARIQPTFDIGYGGEEPLSQRFVGIPAMPSVESAYANGYRRMVLEKVYASEAVVLSYADDVCFHVGTFATQVADSGGFCTRLRHEIPDDSGCQALNTPRCAVESSILRSPMGDAGEVTQDHAEAVVGRDRDAQAAVRGELHRLANEEPVVEDVVVGQDCALGETGGARGELDVHGVVELHCCRYLPHDRDTKYTQSSRAIFESGQAQPLALPVRSPNLNAHAERWVKSVKDECLSKLILFGERSLRRAVHEYAIHYHTERNHQGKDNVLLFPRAIETGREEPVRCRERLGGLLRYYDREAA